LPAYRGLLRFLDQDLVYGITKVGALRNDYLRASATIGPRQRSNRAALHLRTGYALNVGCAFGKLENPYYINWVPLPPTPYISSPVLRPNIWKRARLTYSRFAAAGKFFCISPSLSLQAENVIPI
jgi:hypothetical protein